jgi:hypothetical protein
MSDAAAQRRNRVQPRSSLVVLGLVLSLTMIACGGSSTATQPGGNDATPAAQANTETATEAPPQDGGGGSADACALLTVDEVADATGQPGIAAEPVAEGETDALSACGFVSNGVLPVVITTILDPANTNTDASSYLLLPGSVEVPVNGARAIWMPGAGYVMAVVKGETVATFQVAMPAEGEDFQVTATKLVQKVADRL